ncbi:hypothetical protein [Brucella gallinifaecis]|uniref:hypothetical protein n=1 Tax=Brucella gallinifaecis TaxID=215590 RepID=UPI0023623D21|nr:hypothetical protein [Brucella gallinifaecis]
MHQIDHDQNEPKIDRSPFPWWLAWTMVALCWIGFVYYGIVDWYSVALGGFSVGILASWAVDKTGNRIPGSWRGKH